MQAAAAGIEPDARMNPVLLKPGSDRRSQVVLLGHPDGEVDAVEYRSTRAGCWTWRWTAWRSCGASSTW